MGEDGATTDADDDSGGQPVEAPEKEYPVDGEGGETDAGPDVAPQPEALRRQQLFVGSGIAILAGLAVIVGGVQQLPGYPFVAYAVAGMVTTAILFALLYAGIFRGVG